MATNYPIVINGTTIRTPDNFRISKFNLTKSGRIASGKMTMDLIAKKVKLFLTYRGITGLDLDTILDEIDTEEEFFTVQYYDKRGTAHSKTFYSGEIPATLHSRGLGDDDDVWKDVELHFIEQ